MKVKTQKKLKHVRKINRADVYRLRIANIVGKFMQENWAFRERLNEKEIIASISASMQKLYPLEQFLAIEDSDLSRRIGQRMAIEGLYGLIADLPPAQMQAFNEAVAGK
jgi:hypothetical protein